MHKHAVCHETPHDHVYGWRFVFLLVLPESLGCFQTFIRGDCTIIVLDSSGLSLHNALTGNNAVCLVCNYISFTLSSLFTVSVDCIQAVLTNCKPNISCVLPTKQIRKRTWRQMTDTCVSHSGTLLDLNSTLYRYRTGVIRFRFSFGFWIWKDFIRQNQTVLEWWN